MLGEFPLGGKALRLRDSGCTAGDAVLGPLCWQVQLAIDERRPLGAGIQEEDADLAVRAAASRATVLRRHAGGLLAFLEEARLIDHQDARFLSQVCQDVRAQLITRCFLIPIGLQEQPLYAMGTTLAYGFSQLPAVLALDWGQQAFQKAAHPSTHLGAPKARSNPRLYLIQRLGSAAEHLQFAGRRGVALISCDHLLLLSAAVSRVSVLSGTVVLRNATP